VGVIHDQDLPEITGISKYLLVAGHPGIETNLARSGTKGPKGLAFGDGPIG
jgi:hypothetical protein